MWVPLSDAGSSLLVLVLPIWGFGVAFFEGGGLGLVRLDLGRAA